MNELEILAPCLAPPQGCWSNNHRCFLARCDQVRLLAAQVLGSRSLARRWLHSPAIGLGHQPPCSLITGQAYEQVITLLKRIEMGIYV
ncbi:antitoxin Xre/MbcA/ParS toxin-binding domain-containing protein [Pseudomonas urmiensis]|uniref:antitoxin Xre/MbcA/ParS toxin-binding domain-containing protein n=1 Tax=Pseudomonas urmiensis TaxID=2745493 RepID=UPI003D0F267B